jgi:hypothetical protein
VALFRRTLTRERFAAQALTVVRGYPGVRRAWLDEREFAVRYELGGSGEAAWLHLTTIFSELERAGWYARRRRIEAVLTAVASATFLPDWPDVAPLLRPVLRGDAFGLQPPYERRARLHRPALPYLSEYVVVDQPSSMAYLTPDRVARWGIDPSEVFAAARRNLGRLARQYDPPPRRGQLHLTGDDDCYFPSWLLAPGYLAEQADRLGSRPVAFVPDTSTLLIVPDRPGLVAQALGLVQRRYLSASRALSPVAYTVNDSGAVVPYRAAEPGVLADRQHFAEIRLAADQYAAQRRALRAMLQRDATDAADLHVGTLSLARRADGSAYSTTLWPVSRTTLLPEADFVALATVEGPTTLVPWPIVRLELGPAREPGLVPPRYRMPADPTPAALARLRAESVQIT